MTTDVNKMTTDVNKMTINVNKMTINVKKAKNGTRLYYVDGKRVSRDIALKAAADNRKDKPFTVKCEHIINSYFVHGASEQGVYIHSDTFTELKLDIDSYHGFTVRCGCDYIHEFRDKNAARELVAKIEDAFIAGEKGCKIALNGKFDVIKEN